MMKNRIIPGVITASAILLTMLSACGKASFGLKDFEGLYCRTETEKIEGLDVTYTNGYLLNGDGTGMHYGQDNVEFTWNETELHFPDNTENFTMKPGKLTVGDLVYDKVKGNFITPEPIPVNIENIDNGNYYVSIDKAGISETDGKVTIKTEIFTEDIYDIVDVARMSEGDVIYINGRLLPVHSVTETASGIKEINGGVENNGSALRPVDESNCFVYAGMDMERSYTRRGIADLAVSENVRLIDNGDPAEEKVSIGSEAISALKEIAEDYPFTCHDGYLLVENGEIIEIHRTYRP